MLIDNSLVAVCHALDAWTENVLVPIAVGVPKMVPEPPKVSPVGKLPLLIDQRSNPSPPDASSDSR